MNTTKSAKSAKSAKSNRQPEPKVARSIIHGYVQDTNGDWWLMNAQRGWVRVEPTSRGLRYALFIIGEGPAVERIDLNRWERDGITVRSNGAAGKIIALNGDVFSVDGVNHRWVTVEWTNGLVSDVCLDQGFTDYVVTVRDRGTR